MIVTAIRKLLLVLCGTAAGFSCAQASPILWTLSGVTLFDNATATGSFVYDAATPLYSSINILVSGGYLNFPSVTFQSLDATFGVTRRWHGGPAERVDRCGHTRTHRFV